MFRLVDLTLTEYFIKSMKHYNVAQKVTVELNLHLTILKNSNSPILQCKPGDIGVNKSH